jgi:hypothetical protein
VLEAAFFGFLVGTSFFAHGAEAKFAAAGQIKTVLASGANTGGSSFSARFDGARSFVSVHYENGEVIDSGTDGVDSYTVNRMAVARKRDPQTPEFGYVSEATFPARSLLAAQVIWIGLGAFRTPNGVEPTLWPLEVFEKFPDGAVAMSLKRIEESPELPYHVRWFGPSYIMSGKSRMPVEQYTNGWLGAELAVKAWTNFNGMRLPVRFELQTYRPKLPGTFEEFQLRRPPEDVELVAATSVLVTNLSMVPLGPEFLPALGPRVNVRDWRFKDKLGGEAVSYNVGDARWPGRKNQMLRNLADMRETTSLKPDPATPGLIRVVLLVSAIAVPLALILWRLASARSMKANSKERKEDI